MNSQVNAGKEQIGDGFSLRPPVDQLQLRHKKNRLGAVRIPLYFVYFSLPPNGTLWKNTLYKILVFFTTLAYGVIGAGATDIDVCGGKSPRPCPDPSSAASAQEEPRASAASGTDVPKINELSTGYISGNALSIEGFEVALQDAANELDAYLIVHDLKEKSAISNHLAEKIRVLKMSARIRKNNHEVTKKYCDFLNTEKTDWGTPMKSLEYTRTLAFDESCSKLDKS